MPDVGSTSCNATIQFVSGCRSRRGASATRTDIVVSSANARGVRHLGDRAVWSGAAGRGLGWSGSARARGGGRRRRWSCVHRVRASGHSCSVRHSSAPISQTLDRRLVHDAGVDALQPVVVPAHDLLVVAAGERALLVDRRPDLSLRGASMPLKWPERPVRCMCAYAHQAERVWRDLDAVVAVCRPAAPSRRARRAGASARRRTRGSSPGCRGRSRGSCTSAGRGRQAAPRAALELRRLVLLPRDRHRVAARSSACTGRRRMLVDAAVVGGLAVEVGDRVPRHDRLQMRRLLGGDVQLDRAEVGDADHVDVAVAPGAARPPTRPGRVRPRPPASTSSPGTRRPSA